MAQHFPERLSAAMRIPPATANLYLQTEKLMTENTTHPNDVRRLLRKKSTGQFATGSAWTNNPEDAKVFNDVLEAARECARRDLHDVELTLRVDAYSCDFFCTKLD